MFEKRSEKLLPFRRFAVRMWYALLIAFGTMIVALLIGTIGYHFIAGVPVIDALMNAAMILTGMGPVAPMQTVASKLFATAYALFSGVVFLSSVGVLFAPILHRVLHHFHLDDSSDTGEEADKPKRAKR